MKKHHIAILFLTLSFLCLVTALFLEKKPIPKAAFDIQASVYTCTAIIVLLKRNKYIKHTGEKYEVVIIDPNLSDITVYWGIPTERSRELLLLIHDTRATNDAELIAIISKEAKHPNELAFLVRAAMISVATHPR